MDILYQDKQLVVCLKPVGLDSEKQLPNLLQEKLGGTLYPVHRLDLNVAGVMVYARTRQTAALLSQLIQEGKMVKEYVALVHGNTPDEASWEDLLWKDSRKNKVFVVSRKRRGVKEARLSFWKLSGDEATSLVRIRLDTGRSHQIRVQFASRGFPLVGDHKYGSRDKRTEPMLFSCQLSFPYLGKVHTFEVLPQWAENENLSSF